MIRLITIPEAALLTALLLICSVAVFFCWTNQLSLQHKNVIFAVFKPSILIVLFVHEAFVRLIRSDKVLHFVFPQPKAKRHPFKRVWAAAHNISVFPTTTDRAMIYHSGVTIRPCGSSFMHYKSEVRASDQLGSQAAEITVNKLLICRCHHSSEITALHSFPFDQPFLHQQVSLCRKEKRCPTELS